MAVLYITEYALLARDEDGHVIQAGQEPAVTDQKVTFTGGVAASAAFNSSTRFVRLYSDTAGYIVFGPTPVAVTVDDTPISATTPEFFGVKPGIKVSIIL
jgi:hypothetical protein